MGAPRPRGLRPARRAVAPGAAGHAFDADRGSPTACLLRDEATKAGGEAGGSARMDAHKNWGEITRTLSAAMGGVRRGVPNVTKAFAALAAAATAPGALDAKTKELMAVAISI